MSGNGKKVTKITTCYQSAIDRPPLQRDSIGNAVHRCYPLMDRLSLSWHYANRLPYDGWNHFGPPDVWLIEVLRHTNHFLRLRMNASPIGEWHF